MKYLIYLIAIILLLGINIGLFGNLPIKGQIPNLLMLLTIYFSVDKGSYDFYFVAFTGGLFLDCFSSGAFGGWTFGFLVLALLLHSLSSRLLVFELNWKSLALLVIGSFTLVNFCLWLYGFLAFKLNLTTVDLGLKIYATNFLPGVFYNLLLLYPMYLIFDRMKTIISELSTRSRGVVR